MECPHVEQINVNSPILDIIRTLDFKFQCAECSAAESAWLCLSCGSINCGRYVNSHAIHHYEANSNHVISMSCETASLYCYKCDNDIETISQNNSLEWLRQNISNSYNERNGSDNSSNVSGSDVTSETSCTTTEDNGGELRILTLRPRKKLNENGSSAQKKKQTRRTVTRGQKKYREKKAVGLRNLGNTCFMNAVLQSLNNIHPFSLYIKQLPSFENLKNSPIKRCNNIRQTRNSKEIDDVVMAEELRKILLSLNEVCEGTARQSAISPESLFLVIWKVVPRFRGYQQQDAHEFLRYMLDRLHMELLLLLPEFSLSNVNIGQKGRASIVTCVFGGVLQNEVVCLNCSSVSIKHDPFLDLSLDIPEKHAKIYAKRNGKSQPEVQSSTPPVCKIRDCLSSFIEVEELADTEMYYCNNCKGKQRSTKRFWIRRLPNVLCLHLKRFRWINYYRTKIDTAIEFPIESLDVSDYVLRDVRDTRHSGVGCCLYDLAAVIVHHGSGAGSGHYTAFAIHDGQWFHFNDSSVQHVQRETVINCKPYILFYIRKEVRLPKLSPSPSPPSSSPSSSVS